MGLLDKLFNKKRGPIASANHIGAAAPTGEYMPQLKKYAMQFIPGPIDDVGTQKEMFGMVKSIFPIEEFMLGIQIQSAFESNNIRDLTPIQLQGGIAGITDRWMGHFNKDAMLAKIRQTETDKLLCCWIVLAFYCDILKPEYKVNISEYFNLIASEIYNRGFQIPTQEEIVPDQFVYGSIYIDSGKFMAWKKANPAVPQVNCVEQYR